MGVENVAIQVLAIIPSLQITHIANTIILLSQGLEKDEAFKCDIQGIMASLVNIPNEDIEGDSKCLTSDCFWLS